LLEPLFVQEAAMIERLHHVNISVPTDQVAQARAFYCGLLGLREIPKPESLLANGGFWLELAGQEIHVSIEAGIDRVKTKAHIAFQVADIAAWRSKLEAAGFALLEGSLIPGYQRFETRDPFGNRLEFIAPDHRLATSSRRVFRPPLRSRGGGSFS
jgi:catechol 2,3-dioxygenase-like lactoylglutathione lyase family enzyme